MYKILLTLISRPEACREEDSMKMVYRHVVCVFTQCCSSAPWEVDMGLTSQQRALFKGLDCCGWKVSESWGSKLYPGGRRFHMFVSSSSNIGDAVAEAIAKVDELYAECRKEEETL